MDKDRERLGELLRDLHMRGSAYQCTQEILNIFDRKVVRITELEQQQKHWTLITEHNLGDATYWQKRAEAAEAKVEELETQFKKLQSNYMILAIKYNKLGYGLCSDE